MGNLIMPYKINDCYVCGDKNTEVRKRGKDYICIRCCKEIDTKKQAQRVAEKTKVRALNNVQRSNGNEDAASRQNLIVDLDWTISRYLRILYSDQYMNLKCYTCDYKKNFGMLQIGHFIPRANMATRFMLDNLRPQCVNCNCNLHGNLSVYERELELENPGLPERLRELSKEVCKPTIEELKQLLIDYRSKLKIIEKEKIKK